ncbi:MAG: putative rane protein [Herbinix sp.]|jgi:stage II sporulation protein D|nr:putative rane protein [Herbinix sp.]
MSIKRKLILIGICIGIVVVVFTVNVIRGMKDNKLGESESTVVQADEITQAEAFRLLSFLEYNRAQRESLSMGITYTKEDMSGWYDVYVNAVWKMGLIESNITRAPMEALTYGTCKELIDKLIIKDPDYQAVYSGISFDFSKADQAMETQEFLELYDAIIAAIPQEEQNIKEETLLVLGNEENEEGSYRMVTDLGKFYYGDAKSYENDYGSQKLDLVAKYLDKGIKAFVCEQELIYIKAVTTQKIVVHNVWIEKGEGLQIDTFINGISKSFTGQYKLPNSIEKVVGDITIENQKVVKILQKPEVIKGKVLQTGKDYIEIQGYGKVALDENFRIYKLYGKISMGPTGSILVGYENTDFVVSLGKISAALITESIKAENIRVLLMTSGYQDYYHNKIELTVASDFTISSKEKEKSYKKGDIVTIEPGDPLLSEGRITVKAVEEGAKIELLSVERSDGYPRYRGSIEISEGDQGLLVINELPLEEYLYAVIPSEMPTYYGLESLRVQAVCARSYAYKHLLANSLSTYGAHVDDSVSYQVYNNISENEDSVLAVKDTYGKVIEYEGEVITAYYFSTSCGHTSEAANVWSNNTNYPYLVGKLLYIGEEGEGADTPSAIADQYTDLSTEEAFRSFLKEEELTTYDSGFNWYRWKVTMKAKELQKVIDANLSKRYNANPELILTKTGEDENGDAIFESRPVDNIGALVDITVLKRERSGIISELLIEGSEYTIKVRTEYNIRALMAPTYDTVIRQDESEVKNLSLLPSAFFVIDKEDKNGKVSNITLTGGGYGHGVGMSQNGVKALADAGEVYEDILSYFYEGTEIGFIYE